MEQPSSRVLGARAKIIGGRPAAQNAYPWQVYFDGAGCGGTIICPKYILTAFHCVTFPSEDRIRVKGETLKNVTVVEGTNKLRGISPGKVHRVKRIITHPKATNPDKTTAPNFPFNNNYDFTILELEDAIKMRSEAQAVYLPSAGDLAKYDKKTKFALSGWGLTDPNDNNGESVPKELQAVSVEFRPLSECPYKQHANGPDQICAAVTGGGKDSCQGDSGGCFRLTNSTCFQQMFFLIGFSKC